MNTGFAQTDTGLAAGILEEILRLSEAPIKTRNMLKKYSTLIQKANQEQKQLESLRSGATLEGQALDNQAKMQNIAQNEAIQTVSPGMAGQASQPQPVMQNQGNEQYA